MKRILILMTAVALSGCDVVPLDMLKPKPVAAPAPVAETESEAMPVDASSEVPADDVAATQPTAAVGSLGKTILSLGTATEPGSWLKTPLVTLSQPGRVTWKGKWVAVTLIPIEGDRGAGSRMSLQAMQLIDLPLTELTEVEVIAQ
ncbi:MAG: D-galactarate dehydratase [Shimia sp.]|uniref:D-galactarate dehydratase n=1 Tax=Shimia sp. TaxID=1954381 RepID=UPI0040588C2B